MKVDHVRLRLISRWLFLLISIALLFPGAPWSIYSFVFPALSPFVAICSMIALRSFSILLFLSIPVLLISLLQRRFFCRNVCPLGLLCEYAGKLGRMGSKSRLKLPQKSIKLVHLGIWIVLITVGGAFLGYPLFLWLDPLAIFSSFSGSPMAPEQAGVMIAAMGVPLLLTISFFQPGSWCVYFCPLGAMQDLLILLRRLLILPGRLIKKNVIVQVVDDNEKDLKGFDRGGIAVSRRSLLAVILGSGWGMLTLNRSKTSGRGILRPPGSIAEEQFTGLCIRCGNCIRICPEKILVADTGKNGIAGFLSPVVLFDNSYCSEKCDLCMKVCPSGAIPRRSFVDKQQFPVGLAVVDRDTCLLNDSECSLCVNACPYGAIETKWDEKAYKAVLLVDNAKCPGCGACELVCPTQPEKAIVVKR